MTCPNGGFVYSKNLDNSRNAMVPSDRGNPRWRDDFDDRNPSTYLAPALNHHTDEISCAIGLASLRRLPTTIVSRLAFVSDFVARLYDASEVCRAYRFMPTSSPFYFPGIVDVDAIRCSKTEF